jgi:hypothetical protein
MFGLTRLIVIAYLVVGVIVAASEDYFDRMGNVEGIISAALGVVLWPLLLADVDLRIGRLDDDGRRRGLVWAPALIQTARTLVARLPRPSRPTSADNTQTYRAQTGGGISLP